MRESARKSIHNPKALLSCTSTIAWYVAFVLAIIPGGKRTGLADHHHHHHQIQGRGCGTKERKMVWPPNSPAAEFFLGANSAEPDTAP